METINHFSLNRIALLIVFGFGILLMSCSKDDEIVIVKDNVAPPDHTIEEVVISNYVQKLYIALLGRKPSSSEQSQGFDQLKAANVSAESRAALIDQILGNAEYFDSEFNRMRSEYLNDLDSADFAGDKIILEFAKTLTSNPLEIALYDFELARLDNLIALEANLKSGNYNFVQSHQVLVNNLEYDQINMGSENFVVSLFQNFFMRYPTAEELAEGKNMVDQKSALMFAKEGNSKDDLIDIFFAHGEYFEGQVRGNYIRFLYREPSDDEIALLATSYEKNKNYKEMQKYILSLDEYVGLK